MNFENLVGQNHIKTTLMNALKTNQVSHAYLFSGPRGTGKTTTARLLAKALNCMNLKDNFEPCDSCEFCNDISDGRMIDMIEIDAASNRGIEEVRDLKEKINFAPTRSKFKVYIIDEVHMMTVHAFNALLKTLEEPPHHTYFILATTEFHKIPETIVSRCQCFEFKRIEKQILTDRLAYICRQENLEFEESALEAIARYSDGGLRDAIGLIEQLGTGGKITFSLTQELLGISNISTLTDFHDSIFSNNTTSALSLIQSLHAQGSDVKQFTKDFIQLLREKMLSAVYSNDNSAVHKYLAAINAFQSGLKIQDSSIPHLPLEIAVIKLCTENPGVGMPVVKNLQTAAVENVQKASVKTFAEPVRDIPVEKAVEKSPPPEIKEITQESKSEPSSEIEGSGDVSIELIQKDWPRILERVKRPSLRNSLKNTVPLKLDGIKLTFQFHTLFYKAQVFEKENNIELDRILNELYRKSFILDGVIKPLEIRPVVDEISVQNTQENHAKTEVQKTPEKKASTEDALSIFGGQLI